MSNDSIVNFRPFDNVEATFYTAEKIVQLVAFDNVASTLLLVWTGLKSPNVDIKRHFALCFVSKIPLLSKDVCCKVVVREKFQRQTCSYIIPLSNGP